MKFMGWSYPDMMSAPDDYVREVIRILNEKQEAAEMEELDRMAKEGIR